MTHIEKSTEIKATIEKVWELISNVERIPEWAKNYVQTVRITSKQRRGVGVTTHEVGVAFGKPYEKDFVVKEWVEKQKIVFESTSGWPWKGAWILKPTRDGTLLTYPVDFELPFEVPRMREVFSKKYEKLLEEWLQNMKTILEGKEASPIRH